MDHNEIRHALSDYLDGSLARPEQEAVGEHLKNCSQCSDALRELKKTVEHVSSLEQVEPPEWMTHKIMTRVRGEAEKKGLFHRLFFPLHIKLPLEALGVVLLAVTAVFVYHNTQPVAPLSEHAAPAFEKTAPPDMEKEQPSKNKAIPGTQALPQKPEYKALDMKQAYEPPPPPALERNIPGPSRQADAPEGAGDERFAEQPAMQPQGNMQDEGNSEGRAASKDAKRKGSAAEQETPKTRIAPRAAAPSSGEAADSLAQGRTRSAGQLKQAQPSGAHLSVAVRSIPEASVLIEKTVKELGGSVTRKETSRTTLDLSVKVPPDRTPELIELLKRLGKVKTIAGMQGDVMTIRLAEVAE
jgi:hypothetical protein